MIDVLCHLELLADPAAELVEAAQLGVTDVVSAGRDPTLPEEIRATVAAPRVWRADGIHPAHVDEPRLFVQLAALEERLHGSAVVALGECGLDARPGMPPVAVQEQALLAQLSIAVARDLPCIFHVVRSAARFLALLQPFAGRVRGLWHGFSGSLEPARRAAAAGIVISAGPRLVDPRARRLRGAVAGLPPSTLVLETDAPDAPLSKLPTVAAEVALLCGAEVAAVRAATTERARRLLGLR